MTRRTIHVCGQDIDKPGHICAFFSSREQEYETLIPYFQARDKRPFVVDGDGGEGVSGTQSSSLPIRPSHVREECR